MEPFARDSKIIRFLLAVFLLGIGSGCAVGVQHDYRRAAPVIHGGSGPFGIGVSDQRTYVVSGESDPSYVGVQRGGYGNPFDVNTVSGAPLTEDFTVTIENALGATKTDSVTIAPGTSNTRAVDALKNTNADRLILLTLHEWQSDTFNNTSLYYDVSLEVFDGQATPLAMERFKGEDDLGGSVWNPPSHATTAVPQAYQTKLEDFFSSPSIASALSGSGNAAPSARVQSGGQVSPGVAGSSAPAGSRLEELERVRKAGLISDDEYQKKRAEILREL